MRLDQTQNAMMLRKDYDFSRSVRELLYKIKDEFNYVEQQLIVSKERDEDGVEDLFEEGRKLFKEIDGEISDFQGDIMRAMPPAVSVLKVAA